MGRIGGQGGRIGRLAGVDTRVDKDRRANNDDCARGLTHDRRQQVALHLVFVPLRLFAHVGVEALVIQQ